MLVDLVETDTRVLVHESFIEDVLVADQHELVGQVVLERLVVLLEEHLDHQGKVSPADIKAFLCHGCGKLEVVTSLKYLLHGLVAFLVLEGLDQG